MVLSYFHKNNTSPLILDNLSFKILPLKKRVDLQAKYFINSAGVYQLDETLHLKKVARRYKKFEEIRLKVANNF